MHRHKPIITLVLKTGLRPSSMNTGTIGSVAAGVALIPTKCFDCKICWPSILSPVMITITSRRICKQMFLQRKRVQCGSGLLSTQKGLKYMDGLTMYERLQLNGSRFVRVILVQNHCELSCKCGNEYNQKLLALLLRGLGGEDSNHCVSRAQPPCFPHFLENSVDS